MCVYVFLLLFYNQFFRCDEALKYDTYMHMYALFCLVLWEGYRCYLLGQGNGHIHVIDLTGSCA